MVNNLILKIMKSSLEKELEEIQKADSMTSSSGEGSKGGNIIGHTKTGKPIYASYNHQNQHDHIYDSNDHRDAMNHHFLISQKASEKLAEKMKDSNYKPNQEVLSFIQHHRQQAAKHLDRANRLEDIKLKRTTKDPDTKNRALMAAKNQAEMKQKETNLGKTKLGKSLIATSIDGTSVLDTNSFSNEINNLKNNAVLKTLTNEFMSLTEFEPAKDVNIGNDYILSLSKDNNNLYSGQVTKNEEGNIIPVQNIEKQTLPNIITLLQSKEILPFFESDFNSLSDKLKNQQITEKKEDKSNVFVGIINKLINKL